MSDTGKRRKESATSASPHLESGKTANGVAPKQRVMDDPVRVARTVLRDLGGTDAQASESSLLLAERFGLAISADDSLSRAAGAPQVEEYAGVSRPANTQSGLKKLLDLMKPDRVRVTVTATPSVSRAALSEGVSLKPYEYFFPTDRWNAWQRSVVVAMCEQSPQLSELLNMWETGAQESAENHTYTSRTITDIIETLALVLGVMSQSQSKTVVQTSSRKIVSHILHGGKLKYLYAYIASDIPRVSVTCLRLLTSMVLCGPWAAREVFTAFDWTFKPLTALSDRRSLQVRSNTRHGAQEKKNLKPISFEQYPRAHYIWFGLALLRVGDSRLREEVLSVSSLFPTLFATLHRDISSCLHEILFVWQTRVFSDDSLSFSDPTGHYFPDNMKIAGVRDYMPSRVYAQIFNGFALEHVARIMSAKLRAPGHQVSAPIRVLRDHTRHFLCLVSDKIFSNRLSLDEDDDLAQTGRERFRRITALRLLRSLKGIPTEDSFVKDVVSNILAYFPDLVIPYVGGNPSRGVLEDSTHVSSSLVGLEPRLSLKYFSNVAFVDGLLRRPGAGQPSKVRIEDILPGFFRKPLLLTGLGLTSQFASNYLICLTSLNLAITACTRVAQCIGTSLPRHFSISEREIEDNSNALVAFETALFSFRRQLPDLQSLVSLYHRLGQGDEVLIRAVVRLIRWYAWLFPGVLAESRIDLGRLFCVLPATTDAGTEFTFSKLPLTVLGEVLSCVLDQLVPSHSPLPNSVFKFPLTKWRSLSEIATQHAAFCELVSLRESAPLQVLEVQVQQILRIMIERTPFLGPSFSVDRLVSSFLSSNSASLVFQALLAPLKIGSHKRAEVSFVTSLCDVVISAGNPSQDSFLASFLLTEFACSGRNLHDVDTTLIPPSFCFTRAVLRLTSCVSNSLFVCDLFDEESLDLRSEGSCVRAHCWRTICVELASVDKFIDPAFSSVMSLPSFVTPIFLLRCVLAVHHYDEDEFAERAASFLRVAAELFLTRLRSGCNVQELRDFVGPLVISGNYLASSDSDEAGLLLLLDSIFDAIDGAVASFVMSQRADHWPLVAHMISSILDLSAFTKHLERTAQGRDYSGLFLERTLRILTQFPCMYWTQFQPFYVAFFAALTENPATKSSWEGMPHLLSLLVENPRLRYLVEEFSESGKLVEALISNFPISSADCDSQGDNVRTDSSFFPSELSLTVFSVLLLDPVDGGGPPVPLCPKIFSSIMVMLREEGEHLFSEEFIPSAQALLACHERVALLGQCLADQFQYARSRKRRCFTDCAGAWFVEMIFKYAPEAQRLHAIARGGGSVFSEEEQAAELLGDALRRAQASLLVLFQMFMVVSPEHEYFFFEALTRHASQESPIPFSSMVQFEAGSKACSYAAIGASGARRFLQYLDEVSCHPESWKLLVPWIPLFDTAFLKSHSNVELNALVGSVGEYFSPLLIGVLFCAESENASTTDEAILSAVRRRIRLSDSRSFFYLIENGLISSSASFTLGIVDVDSSVMAHAFRERECAWKAILAHLNGRCPFCSLADENRETPRHSFDALSIKVWRILSRKMISMSCRSDGALPRILCDGLAVVNESIRSQCSLQTPASLLSARTLLYNVTKLTRECWDTIGAGLRLDPGVESTRAIRSFIELGVCGGRLLVAKNVDHGGKLLFVAERAVIFLGTLFDVEAKTASTTTFSWDVLLDEFLHEIYLENSFQPHLADGTLSARWVNAFSTGLYYLVFGCAKSTLRSHLPRILKQYPDLVDLLLRLYGATTALTDRRIFEILQLCEELRKEFPDQVSGVPLTVVEWGFVWGSTRDLLFPRSRVGHYETRRGLVDSLAKVLIGDSLIDPPLMRATLEHFDRSTSSRSDQNGVVKRPTYDASFLMPFIYHVVSTSENAGHDLRRWCDVGIVSFVLLATTSFDSSIRKLAFASLAHFHKTLRRVGDSQNETRFRGKVQLEVVISAVRNSIDRSTEDTQLLQASDLPRLPKLAGLFLSQAVPILVGNPGHFLFRDLNGFLLHSAEFDFEDVPMFFQLFLSSIDQTQGGGTANEDSGVPRSARRQKWITNLIALSVADLQDLQQVSFDQQGQHFHTADTVSLLRRRHVVELLLSQSFVEDESSRRFMEHNDHRKIILGRIILPICSVGAGAVLFTKHAILLPFLSCIFVNHSLADTEVIELAAKCFEVLTNTLCTSSRGQVLKQQHGFVLEQVAVHSLQAIRCVIRVLRNFCAEQDVLLCYRRVLRSLLSGLSVILERSRFKSRTGILPLLTLSELCEVCKFEESSRVASHEFDGLSSVLALVCTTGFPQLLEFSPLLPQFLSHLLHLLTGPKCPADVLQRAMCLIRDGILQKEKDIDSNAFLPLIPVLHRIISGEKWQAHSHPARQEAIYALLIILSQQKVFTDGPLLQLAHVAPPLLDAIRDPLTSEMQVQECLEMMNSLTGACASHFFDAEGRDPHHHDLSVFAARLESMLSSESAVMRRLSAIMLLQLKPALNGSHHPGQMEFDAVRLDRSLLRVQNANSDYRAVVALDEVGG